MIKKLFNGVLCSLLWVYYSYSETTDNLLEEYTDENINIVGNPYGMSGAEITTGNEGLGGGTRTYEMDVSEFTDIQSIEYGSTVYSHISNRTVPACANTTGDCRDEFSITVRLYENNILQETYSHSYENITWTGKRLFEYSQDVSQLNFNVAEMELYGSDLGYFSGYYGMGFSDMYFTAQYNPIEIITDMILDTAENVALDVETSFNIVVEDTFFEPVEINIDIVDVMIEPTMEMEMPEIEPIEEIQEIEMEVEEIEIDVQEVRQEVAEQIMDQQTDKMSAESQTIQIGLMVALSNTGYDYSDQTIQETLKYEDTTLITDNLVIQDNNANLMGYYDYLKMNRLVDSQWQR
jgi:hypothetical protein